MGQRGFWDEEKRIHRLQQKKPTLATLSEAISWETFRPLLEQGYSHERKSNAGTKRIDPIILFKMLILQQPINVIDEELEFQVNDRRSFEEFVGLGVINTIPMPPPLPSSANGSARRVSYMSFLNDLRSTYAPKGWRPVAGRSSMPHWSLFPNSEIRAA